MIPFNLWILPDMNHNTRKLSYQVSKERPDIEIKENLLLRKKLQSEFGIDETYSTLTWFDWNKEEKPTKKEFDDAVTAWETDYDAQEYARNRVEDYPDWGAQFNKIYDD